MEEVITSIEKWSVEDATQKHMVMYFEPGEIGVDGEFEFFITRLGFTDQAPEIPFFNVIVTNRMGQTLDGSISRDETQIGRYNCSISVKAAGLYTIRIQLDPGQDFKIYGNPIQVMITRKQVAVSKISTPVSRFSAALHVDTNSDLGPPQCTLELDIRLRPWGIATNQFTAEIFIVNRKSHRVLCFQYQNKTLVSSSSFGQKGTELGCMSRPTGIAMDVINDHLIITDKYNHRVNIFGSDGGFIKAFGKFGSGDAEFKSPCGVTVSKDGRYIAVADYDNHRIQLFTTDGVFVRKFFPIIDNSDPWVDWQHFHPRGIVFDNAGTVLYISDYKNGHLYHLDLEMTQMRLISDETFAQHSKGLYVNCDGNIVVCDNIEKCLIVISPTNGTVVEIIREINAVMLEKPVRVVPGFWGLTCVVEENGKIHLTTVI